MKRKNKTLRNDPSTRDDLGEAGRSSHLHLQSFKDVADSEDEFHLNRDVISLRADIDRKDKSKSVEQGMRQ